MVETIGLLDCGHEPSEHSDFTTGYGEYEGRKLCYDCCTKQDIASMDDTSIREPFVGYLSSDSKSITNWPGRPLARVYSVHKVWNNFAQDYILWVKAVVDPVDGRTKSYWSGPCVGPGMCISLRRRKS